MPLNPGKAASLIRHTPGPTFKTDPISPLSLTPVRARARHRLSSETLCASRTLTSCGDGSCSACDASSDLLCDGLFLDGD